MVVPWIWFSIWIFWVIHVLVFLVFQVFSTAELISLAKTVNLAVWAFSLIFLHDFTLFGIDMHNIYHISSISTTFGPLWNMGFPGLDPNLHLALCHTRNIGYTRNIWYTRIWLGIPSRRLYCKSLKFFNHLISVSGIWINVWRSLEPPKMSAKIPKRCFKAKYGNIGS